MPTRRRGSIVLERIEIATRFPYGLFRAWAVLHPDVACLVYPRPADNAPPPPQAPGLAGSGVDAARRRRLCGTQGLPPGRPAAAHRLESVRPCGELLVKEFSGDAEAVPLFDLADAPGDDLESRLSVLARWIVDAHARGETFGLRLPGDEIPPEPGDAQRRRCLAALRALPHPAPDVA